jgi:hypothetical protein
MSEDPTRNLPASFEERVLSELAAINARLPSLEEKVDMRLHETRPIWESMQNQLKGIEKQLDDLNRQFGTLIKDSFNLRVRVEKLEDNQQTV